MCVHAQILIQKSWYFEDKYEDRLFTTKNVQSANQIDNPFISVSATHITYPTEMPVCVTILQVSQDLAAWH